MVGMRGTHIEHKNVNDGHRDSARSVHVVRLVSVANRRTKRLRVLLAVLTVV